MRISDWSSDVCSSDLAVVGAGCRRGWRSQRVGVRAVGVEQQLAVGAGGIAHQTERQRTAGTAHRTDKTTAGSFAGGARAAAGDGAGRSEERRVGNEGVSTGRARWLPYN